MTMFSHCYISYDCSYQGELPKIGVKELKQFTICCHLQYKFTETVRLNGRRKQFLIHCVFHHLAKCSSRTVLLRKDGRSLGPSFYHQCDGFYYTQNNQMSGTLYSSLSSFSLTLKPFFTAEILSCSVFIFLIPFCLEIIEGMQSWKIKCLNKSVLR